MYVQKQQQQQQQQMDLSSTLWTWIKLPFNLWLWSVTIPLRIFLYVAFGDFWKWSKNGVLPKREELQEQIGSRVISYSETHTRSYPSAKTENVKPRRMSVSKTLSTERYPTYISTERPVDEEAVHRTEQPQFNEKAPSFFTVEKSEVKKSQQQAKQELARSADETQIHGFFLVENQVNDHHNTTRKSQAESKQEQPIKFADETQQIHGFFTVENQVNDEPTRRIQVNKDTATSSSAQTEESSSALSKNQKKNAKKAAKKKLVQEESTKVESTSSESQTTEVAESKPATISAETEKLIADLHEQIQQLEEREKQMLHEKLEIESKFENESAHWKEDTESAQKEKAQLREVASLNEKKSFDLQQQICSLRAQLHSHNDFKMDQHQEIKTVWKVPHHEQDFTKIVQKQQEQENHQKTYIEAAIENIGAK